MMFERDPQGRWRQTQTNAPQTLSERFYDCKPEKTSVARRMVRKDDRERLKARVSKTVDCYVAQENEAHQDKPKPPLSEFLDEKWFSEVEALAKEAEEIVDLAKEAGDRQALEAIRKRFERFLPPVQTKQPEDPEEFRDRLRLKRETKRKGQRLKH